MRRFEQVEVSVLMPVKNGQVYIVKTLKSIINQTFKNWELIVVNDHSSDNTTELVKSFSDTRIRLVDNKGEGIISALQTAYFHSKGKFITRMDADDLMPEKKLEWMYQALQTSPKTIVIGKVKYFSDEFEIQEGYKKYEKWLNERVRNKDWIKEQYKECVIASSNWMIFREDFDVLGAFDKELYPEDYELCFRFLNSGLNILGLDKVTHLWRDHINRTSRTSEVYADNSFLDLKLNMFLRYTYQLDEGLFLWGAGKKGKRVARYFLEKKIEFNWITDNPKKAGLNIYNIPLKKTCEIFNAKKNLCLVATSQDQLEIKEKLERANIKYHFLC